jgi:hypothetical protein
MTTTSNNGFFGASQQVNTPAPKPEPAKAPTAAHRMCRCGNTVGVNESVCASCLNIITEESVKPILLD